MEVENIIVGLDPGKQKDSFAMVEIGIKDKKIYILGAKGWLGRAYLQVEQELVEIHKEIQADVYVIELNNTGDHVREELVANGLPVRGVTTSKNLKDRKKNRNTMDKNEMVRWILVMIQECRIVFPNKDSTGTAELKRQMSIFAEKKTEAGSVSYGAEGKELSRITFDNYYKGERNVIQIHTHPSGNVDMSLLDREWEVVNHVGALSIIVPNYGFHGLQGFRGVHVYEREVNDWRLWSHEEIIKRLKIV